MIFTLEALPAKHGDALLLHFGTASAPRLVVVDGGPGGVFKAAVRPRLLEIREAVAKASALDLHAVVVSHIDDDHIRGVLDLFTHLSKAKDDGVPADFRAAQLWHNSFESIVGGPAGGSAAGASPADVSPAELPVVTPAAAAIVASIAQGRRLRDTARRLAVPVNPGFADLVAATGTTAPVVDWPGLKVTILGPNSERAERLRAEWRKHLAKKGQMPPADWQRLAAAYIDESVPNLSSIVMLVKAGKRTMLLTGDARGDDILAAVERYGLAKKGKLHVDVLKVPHHGSDRNVETDFFRKVTADHYVISADGTHGNPDPATAVMITEARGKTGYTIHLTNAVKPFMAKASKGTLSVRPKKAPSVVVDLAEPLPY